MNSHKHKTTSSKKSKNWIRILVGVFAIASLVLGYLFLTDKIHISSKDTDSQNQNQNDGYSPPTQEEKNAGNEQKDKIVNNNPPTSNTNTQPAQGKKRVTVLITDASQYDSNIEVRSFIPDFYENGTCTITFTKGSLTVVKSTPAYKDNSTTICTNPVIFRSEFKEPGTWQVVVSYESTNAQGTSQGQSITIN